MLGKELLPIKQDALQVGASNFSWPQSSYKHATGPYPHDAPSPQAAKFEVSGSCPAGTSDADESAQNNVLYPQNIGDQYPPGKGNGSGGELTQVH